MKKQNIILVGGGGHCKSVIEVIEAEQKFKIMGILDLPSKIGSQILDYNIIDTDDSIAAHSKKCKFFLVTVGQIKSASLRATLYNKILDNGGTLPNIIAPNAYISKYAKLGTGNIIMHSAIINAGVEIGNNCIINNKSLIEHDCTIGDHVHVSTGVNINGNCHIGDGSFIGSGSTIIQDIVIKENVVIGAGSVIINNIDKNKTLIGNPGRNI